LVDAKKQAISLRIGTADLRRIKRLAERLGVHDSDVVRFAVKTMLTKLAPLCDPNTRGRSLVPVFVESGTDIFQHFDLDAVQLDTIINEGADDAECVEHTDLQLLAMTGIRNPMGDLSLRRLGRRATDDTGTFDTEELRSGMLKRYMYDKYGYGEENQPLVESVKKQA
jgi:hypothetical protein